jgi:RHH-type transcriptional regulator, rel operon repressor / antitoxin RelB
MLAIRLDPEVERRLAVIAARTGRSTADHVQEAILSHLEDLEDVQIAEERLGNPGRRWTLDEVERELGLDD